MGVFDKMTKLMFHKLRDDAKLPSRKYRWDAGLDVHTLDKVRIGPGQQAVIQTGLRLTAAPRGIVIQVWPKSGLDARVGAHTGAGIIDSGYRSEVLILVKNTNREHWIEFEAGDAVAQLVVVPCEYPEVKEFVVRPSGSATSRKFWEEVDRGTDGGITETLEE